jgi:hypothetical protein
MYIILPFFSISLLWWSNPYSEAYYYRRIASAEGLLTELPRALTFPAKQLTTGSGWGCDLTAGPLLSA